MRSPLASFAFVTRTGVAKLHLASNRSKILKTVPSRYDRDHRCTQRLDRYHTENHKDKRNQMEIIEQLPTSGSINDDDDKPIPRDWNATRDIERSEYLMGLRPTRDNTPT